jgi:hypothetical protein
MYFFKANRMNFQSGWTSDEEEARHFCKVKAVLVSKSSFNIHQSRMVKNSCKSMQIREYTPVADGTKQLQINANPQIYQLLSVENSCKLM